VELADIVDYVRAGQPKPAGVIVWANLPSVLSDIGNSFGCFLGTLAGEDCELQANGDERPVVLNSVAKSIIEKQRGISGEWVLPYNGTVMHRMNDSAWKKARVRAAKLWQEKNLRPAHPGYMSFRIHDLKHTFSRRLRAAGVTEKDRKALLGHENGSITSHDSGAELDKLINAENMVSATDSRGPVLTTLKRKQA